MVRDGFYLVALKRDSGFKWVQMVGVGVGVGWPLSGEWLSERLIIHPVSGDQGWVDPCHCPQPVTSSGPSSVAAPRDLVASRWVREFDCTLPNLHPNTPTGVMVVLGFLPVVCQHRLAGYNGIRFEKVRAEMRMPRNTTSGTILIHYRCIHRYTR